MSFSRCGSAAVSDAELVSVMRGRGTLCRLSGSSVVSYMGISSVVEGSVGGRAGSRQKSAFSSQARVRSSSSKTGSKWPAHKAHKQLSNQSEPVRLERLWNGNGRWRSDSMFVSDVSQSTMTNGPAGALEAFWKDGVGCADALGDWEGERRA